MKTSCKKLKEFIKDEAKGSKEYHKHGYHSQARDESKHKKFFMKELKKC